MIQKRRGKTGVPQFVRYVLYLTVAQRAQLSTLSEQTGMPIAELARRAIDKYLDEANPYLRETSRALR